MTTCLLWGEVLNRSHYLTGCGQGNLVSNTSDTEVGNFHATFGSNEHVSRLDITVDQTGSMSSLKGCSGLRNNVKDLVD